MFCHGCIQVLKEATQCGLTPWIKNPHLLDIIINYAFSPTFGRSHAQTIDWLCDEWDRNDYESNQIARIHWSVLDVLRVHQDFDHLGPPCLKTRYGYRNEELPFRGSLVDVSTHEVHE
jgi:hypothetical protein